MKNFYATSILRAQIVWFNSNWNQETFINALVACGEVANGNPLCIEENPNFNAIGKSKSSTQGHISLIFIFKFALLYWANATSMRWKAGASALSNKNWVYWVLSRKINTIQNNDFIIIFSLRSSTEQVLFGRDGGLVWLYQGLCRISFCSENNFWQ